MTVNNNFIEGDKSFDEVTFRALTSMSSLFLLSLGIMFFWLSNNQAITNITLFSSMMMASLVIRFYIYFFIYKELGNIFVAIIPILWFVILCYLMQSGTLDSTYLNFWMGLFFFLIGFVRTFESFNTIIKSFRLCMLALAAFNFVIGYCLLVDWPSSQLWNVWILVGLDLVTTSLIWYLFTLNILDKKNVLSEIG